MKKKQQFVVKKDGVPCGFVCQGCFGFKRGVLAKSPERFAVFGGTKSANQAIARTVKTMSTLKGSMLDGWPKLAPVIEPGIWAVEPVAT